MPAGCFAARFRRLLPALCLILALTACGAGTSPAGKYKARHGQGPEVREVVLELREDGQGSLSMDVEAVPLRWDAKGKDILLHVKSGGVMTARAEGRSLRLDMPGVGVLEFERQGR